MNHTLPTPEQAREQLEEAQRHHQQAREQAQVSGKKYLGAHRAHEQAKANPLDAEALSNAEAESERLAAVAQRAVTNLTEAEDRVGIAQETLKLSEGVYSENDELPALLDDGAVGDWASEAKAEIKAIIEKHYWRAVQLDTSIGQALTAADAVKKSRTGSPLIEGVKVEGSPSDRTLWVNGVQYHARAVSQLDAAVQDSLRELEETRRQSLRELLEQEG